MINLQTEKNAYNIVACTIYIKKMKLLMSSKSEKDHNFFTHQQGLQNFPLLDVSKSLTIFLSHYY